MTLSHRIEIDPAAVCSRLESAVECALVALRRDGVVLGLSGGLDSSVAAAICSRAVGRERVLGLAMPERDSDPGSLRDARLLARVLGIRVEEIRVDGVIAAFGAYRLSPLRFLPRALVGRLLRKAYAFHERSSGETPFAGGLDGVAGKRHGKWIARGNAYYRIKHRVRMVALYMVAERENRLVVGAANKTEWMTGFFVKWGCDHAADCMPLLGLYKTQVLALARHLGLPAAIVEKAPSPDLLPGITDEFALGVRYRDLDLILLGLEEGMEEGKIAAEAGVSPEDVEKVRALVERSRHMREAFHGSPP